MLTKRFVGSIRVDPTWQVGQSSDDCQRRLTPAYFALIDSCQAGFYDLTNFQYGTGMRFNNITIPAGATITNVYLTLRARGTHAFAGCNTRISAEDENNPGTFINNAAVFDARWANRTVIRVDWAVPAFVAGNDYDSPEIRTVIKEIIYRSIWNSGNSMVIFWEDFEDRSTHGPNISLRDAHSYDTDPANAIKLVIEYVLPAGDCFSLHQGTYAHYSYQGSALLSNNNLIAVINVGPSDGLGFYDLVQSQLYSSISADNGQTWGAETLLADKGGGWGAISGFFLPTSSGKIYCFYGRYTSYRPIADSEIWVKESNDNGVTWVNEHQIITGHNYSLVVTNGIELRDGTLIMPFAWGTDVGASYWKSSVLISNDGGATWGVGGTIDHSVPTGSGCDEPTIVELSSGDLYALVRTDQGHLYYSVSSDNGITWSAAVASGLESGDINGYLRRVSFSPNKISVCWCNDPVNRWPLVMAYSMDDCVTWSTPETIMDAGYDTSMPNLTIAADGGIIVTWWDNPAPGEDTGRGTRIFLKTIPTVTTDPATGVS